MRRLSWTPAAVAGLLALVALLYVAVASFAFAPASYPHEGVYGEMADGMIAYLRGDAEGLDDALFTERERLHMDDVHGLFAGGRRLAIGCAVGAAVLAMASLVWGGRRAVGRGALIGMATFAALVAFMGIWAAIDFTGWFVTMHELVFTNDLWLLNPAESLLINMLPETFFSSAVRTIVVRFVILATVLGLVAALLGRDWRRRESDGISE